MPYGVVYLLTNLTNGRYYIGQTVNFTQRMMQHGRSKARLPIACAIRAHGWANFSREILGEAEDQESLDALEKLWITVANSLEVGYNLKEGGSAGRHTEKTKAKISAAHAGRKHTAEHIEARASKIRGRKRPDVSMRLCAANRGRLVSEDTRKKMSESRKRAAILYPRKMTDANKSLLIAISKGRVVSAETRRRLSESHRRLHESDSAS